MTGEEDQALKNTFSPLRLVKVSDKSTLLMQHDQAELEHHRTIRNDDRLSSLELLPTELVWAIVEYAPEAVNDLRLGSRAERHFIFVARLIILESFRHRA